MAGLFDDLIPKPPPGVMIHGADESYVVGESGEPVASVQRDRSGYEGNVQLEALRRRAGQDMNRGLMPLAQGVGLTATDELASAIAAGATAATTDRPFKAEYDINQEIMRQELAQRREEAPISSAAQEILGSVGSGVGLLRTGVTASRFIPQGMSMGRNYLARLGANTADAIALGALMGAGGSRQGERTSGATQGATIGAIAGPAAQIGTSAAKAVGAPVYNAIAARVNPQKYADLWMNRLLQRSTQPNVVSDVAQARQAGDDVYTLMDALGRSGQRAGSVVARTPSDAQQDFAEQLIRRQAGQRERVSGLLSEAMDRPMTAQQTEAALREAREQTAELGYGLADALGGRVNTSRVAQVADDYLAPSVNSRRTALESEVAKWANQIRGSDDFMRIRRIRSELGGRINEMGRQGKHTGPLDDLLNATDEALEMASGPYRVARNSYREMSRPIEAIQSGTQAARPSSRAIDVAGQVQRMTPEEMLGFRAGYSDPLLSNIERQSIGANVARPFTSPKMQSDMASIAGPRNPAFQRGIQREMAMNEAYQQALTGSRTAENLADAADVAANFDPSVAAGLFTGDLSNLGQVAGRFFNAVAGQPPAVRDRMARMLLERNPNIVQNIVDAAQQAGRKLNATEQAFVRALTAGGAIVPATR